MMHRRNNMKVNILQHNTASKFIRFVKRQWIWWLMLLPGIVLTLVFKYGSMFGIVMAFQKFDIFKGTFFGQEWASNHGFGNFIYIFKMEKFFLLKRIAENGHFPEVGLM